MSLRVVFMGTPDFAVPSLEALVEAGFEVPLVLTRPDAVRGRGRALMPTPVKLRAQELGLSCYETARLDSAAQERVFAAHADVLVVAAFGALVPDSLLGDAAARLGVVNVHGSLLPRWRGAAPIQRAVLAGDERVGISIMRIVHDLDAGPWCRQASVEAGDRSASELMDVLAELGARELVMALHELDAGEATWHEQDEAQVTYAPKVEKTEMVLQAVDSAESNLRRVRAATDAAPARTSVGGRGLRVIAAQVASAEDVATLAGGTLAEAAVAVRRGRVLLGCSDGALELLRVKPDGKREMDASAWAAGLRGELTWGDPA